MGPPQNPNMMSVLAIRESDFRRGTYSPFESEKKKVCRIKKIIYDLRVKFNAEFEYDVSSYRPPSGGQRRANVTLF